MIFDHQIPAYEKLLALGRASFGMSRYNLKVRPRTNTLIVAPSGSGKSHLAREVSKELGAPFLSVSLSEWILLGCVERGARNTWPMIFDFVARHHEADGLVIFVDEIDKMSTAAWNRTSWNQHLTCELLKLADFQIPAGIRINDDEDPDPKVRQRAESVLKNRTLLLGAGAFQDTLWESISKPNIGFLGGKLRTDSADDRITLANLKLTLCTELVTRFRSDLVILPQLTRKDYARMLEQTAVEVPPYMRETFLRLGYERIPDAVTFGQGCRFVEELLLDTMIEERKLLHVPQSLGPAEAPNVAPLKETEEPSIG